MTDDIPPLPFLTEFNVAGYDNQLKSRMVMVDTLLDRDVMHFNELVHQVRKGTVSVCSASIGVTHAGTTPKLKAFDQRMID